jgi:hypothetical protein
MLPPNMQQLIRDHPGKILLFYCGDYHEAYGAQATKAAKIVKRDLTTIDGVKVLLIPTRCLKDDLEKLLSAGERVAVCEQTEEEHASGTDGRGEKTDRPDADAAQLVHPDAPEERNSAPTGGREGIRTGGETAQQRRVPPTRHTVPPVAGRCYKLEQLPDDTEFHVDNGFGGMSGALLSCNFSEAKVRLDDGKTAYWSPATLVIAGKISPKTTENGLISSNADVKSSRVKNESLSTKDGRVMKITKSKAVELLNNLGVKSVTPKWGSDKVAERLLKVAKTPGAIDPETITDSEVRELLDEVLGSIESGKEIEIVDTDEPKKEEKEPVKESKKKGGGKPAPATSASRETKSNPDKIDRDKYGSRMGSDCAKVNQKLSKKPMTEPELRKAAGVNSSVEYHLDKLVRLGVLSWKEDEGYRLK